MKTLFRRSLTLLLAVLVLSVCVNAVSPRGIPLLGPVPQPPEIEGLRAIDVGEAYRLFREQRSVFVDSRSETEFLDGRIPGARRLSLDNFPESVSAFRALIPPDTTLVTYCSGEGCGSSREVAQLLLDSGFTDIRDFSGGWERWVEAGHPREP